MNENVFMTQQLNCMLPALAVKVLNYLINWKKYDVIKYYPNQMTKFMHISEDELDRALQTLIDNRLIDTTSIDGIQGFILNKKKIMSYINVPMQKVHDTEGFKLADMATWNKALMDEKVALEESGILDNLPPHQIKRIINMLQVQLNEKEQVRKIVQNNDNDLPF